MIKSVQILDTKKTAIAWLGRMPDFPSSFEFTPGLNILWGPNGSGKSTLLRLLARMFHCEQGQDEQKVTRVSADEMYERHSDEKTASRYPSVQVEHDGSPVVYLDSAVGKGQMYPGHFDDDFFAASLASHMFKGSAGQTVQQRLGTFLLRIVEGPFKEPVISNLYHKNRSVEIEAFFKGTLPKDRPTVLFDEPDRSLDLAYQVLVWNFIRNYQDQVQFIVAAHNLIACEVKGANYITFGDPQYLEYARDLKNNLDNPPLPKVTEEMKRKTGPKKA